MTNSLDLKKSLPQASQTPRRAAGLSLGYSFAQRWQITLKRTVGSIVLASALTAYTQNIQLLASNENAAIVIDSLAVANTARDSVAAVLRGETEKERTFWLRRQAFVESVFEQSAYALGDSGLFFRFALTAGQLGLDQKGLSKISPQQDYIGDRLRSQQGGTSSLFNIGDLLGRGVKYLASKVGVGKSVISPWTILPSETEVRVMKVLWQKADVTSAEIYAQLDSAKLHYKEVNIVLENMVGRGLVERKQISPSNEFTVPGGFTIEMSSLNAKNREYVYRPRAKRELMLAYLDASAFSHQQPHSPAEAMLQQHLRKLLTLLANESAGL